LLPAIHSLRSRTPLSFGLLVSACWWGVAIGIGLVFVATLLIVTNKFDFSCDELLTWYPISGSFQVMTNSMVDTINAAPPLYFCVAWIWGKVFGTTALSLRLLSVLPVCLAMGLMFEVLRRAWGGLAAAVALVASMTYGGLLEQMIAVRFHTFFFAEVALAILLYQRLLEKRRPSFTLLALNAAAHASMMMTTYTAPFFSGALLGGMICTGIVRRRFPLQACVSVVCGWLVFLPWMSVFVLHRGMVKPGNWLAYPVLSTLVQTYRDFLPPDVSVLGWGIMGLFLAGVCGALYAGNVRYHLWPAVSARQLPLILLCPILGLIPLFFYSISSPATEISLLLPRYYLPSLFALQIAVAHLVRWCSRSCVPLGERWLQRNVLLAQMLIVFTMVAWTSSWVIDAAVQAPPVRAEEASLAVIPDDALIVAEHFHDFLRLHYYSKIRKSQVVFLTDWNMALRDGGGRPLEFRIVNALKRCFPAEFSAAVREAGAVLASTRSFYVKSDRAGWVEALLDECAPSSCAFALQALPNGLTHVRRAN